MSLSESTVVKIESYLSRRAHKRALKKQKQAKKHPVRDWVEAILWAVGFVFLLNQYLAQAYAIPSESMVGTLLIGDRLFVNKILYGPEVLPGLGKIHGAEPSRYDVICLVNPRAADKGVAFNVTQRMLYMLTFSLVNLVDEKREEPPLLVKRLIGKGGDNFIQKNGEMWERIPGLAWMKEDDFKQLVGAGYTLNRIWKPEQYVTYSGAIEAFALEKMGFTLTPSQQKLILDAKAQPMLPELGAATFEQVAGSSPWVLRGFDARSLYALAPEEALNLDAWGRVLSGWYVAQGRVLPLGDNRDNSTDGRIYGTVDESKVLGKAMFIYWPLGRIGPIR